MRIGVRLPKVEPTEYDQPEECPQEGCGGRRFKPYGVRGERKAIRDMKYDEVKGFRWRRLKCNQTFRVYS